MVVATFSDHPSAQLLGESLRAEGLPVHIKADSSILGEARRCDVLVPTEFAHRARWLLTRNQVSDAELLYLATGETGTIEGDTEKDH